MTPSRRSLLRGFLALPVAARYLKPSSSAAAPLPGSLKVRSTGVWYPSLAALLAAVNWRLVRETIEVVQPCQGLDFSGAPPGVIPEIYGCTFMAYGEPPPPGQMGLQGQVLGLWRVVGRDHLGAHQAAVYSRASLASAHMKRRKRPAKNVAKMRNGSVIEFTGRQKHVLVYESAFAKLSPHVRRQLLTGDWPPLN